MMAHRTQKTHKPGAFLSQEQLSGIFDHFHMGVFTVDAERRVTSFSRAAEMLIGYSEKDVVGKPCHEVFQNNICCGECKFHEAVEAEQKSLSFNMEIEDGNKEKQIITKIVTPLYDANQTVTGCIEIFQDHSVFEELINRIRYDDRKLKIILDNLDIGIFTVTRGGHITFFNTLAEKITGHDRKEVLGKPCSTVLDEDSSDGVFMLKESIADGRPRSNRKGLLKTRDGLTIPIAANYMALRNEQGRIVGGLATIQDLSLIHQLNRAISNRYTFADIVGKGPRMQKIFEIIPVVADSDATVLIEGATGTGKDLLAKVIHNASRRAKRPMVKVNCAALPGNLLESEIFGYVKGAFTGADRDKPGRFQEADGGTIFLDEIGDLPLVLQAKLLRVLEEKEFYPLGSRKTTRVDVRIVVATNQGLEGLVARKKFREDLFYRLNVIRLEMPRLAERKEDIPLLITHIMKRLRAARERDVARISEKAMEILLNHDYPGNVRELENILEHALVVCQDDIIERRHLPLFLQERFSSAAGAKEPSDSLTTARSISEKDRILETLDRFNWHRDKAARDLDINRSTLWRKIKKYGLSR